MEKSTSAVPANATYVPVNPSDPDTPLVLSYLGLRKAVGIIGLTLPFTSASADEAFAEVGDVTRSAEAGIGVTGGSAHAAIARTPMIEKERVRVMIWMCSGLE